VPDSCAPPLGRTMRRGFKVKWVFYRYAITTPLEAGMIVSNEPGYYEDGSFGIRIENLLAIKEMETPFRFGGQSYLGFERLTFCPLQHKMIAAEVSQIVSASFPQCIPIPSKFLVISDVLHRAFLSVRRSTTILIAAVFYLHLKALRLYVQ
jgi:hypothetical protein